MSPSKWQAESSASMSPSSSLSIPSLHLGFGVEPSGNLGSVPPGNLGSVPPGNLGSVQSFILIVVSSE